MGIPSDGLADRYVKSSGPAGELRSGLECERGGTGMVYRWELRSSAGVDPQLQWRFETETRQ